jgi:hypothetical protein
MHAATKTVAAAPPDARITVLEGQRHIAIDAAPQLLVSTIVDFLDDLAP